VTKHGIFSTFEWLDWLPKLGHAPVPKLEGFTKP